MCIQIHVHARLADRAGAIPSPLVTQAAWAGATTKHQLQLQIHPLITAICFCPTAAADKAPLAAGGL
jgi:hypothetical protein